MRARKSGVARHKKAQTYQYVIRKATKAAADRRRWQAMSDDERQEVIRATFRHIDAMVRQLQEAARAQKEDTTTDHGGDDGQAIAAEVSQTRRDAGDAADPTGRDPAKKWRDVA